ncbi:hypothetical protein IIA16_05020, partial [bacterium]|nr:hypothetical protein [bacterium]
MDRARSDIRRDADTHAPHALVVAVAPKPWRLATAWLLAALSAISVSPLAAHPGYGVEVDGEGRVYFSTIGVADSAGVWMWDPAMPDAPILIVPGVWSHGVILTDDGSLWGADEHQPSSGAPADSSIWRRSPDGGVKTVVPPQGDRGQLDSEAFTVDGEGNVYFFHQGWRRRSLEGVVEGLAS